MRNLFLLLLLVNVLFAAWQFFIVPADVNPYALRDGNRERELPLFPMPASRSPRPNPPMAGAAGVAKAGTASSPGADRIAGPGCFQVGPFSDSAGAGGVRDRLGQTGVAVTESTREGQEWLGHWVKIENLPDQSAADAAIGRLAAAGVPDATSVAQAAAVELSLGVYKTRSRADSVAARARSLGYSPTVTDRYRAGTQYWVELRLGAEQSVSLAGLAGESGQILRAESAPCAAVAPLTSPSQ